MYFYTKDAVQKLIDICFTCVLTATDDKYPQLKNGTDEEKATWVARQLRLCGYDTEPIGASWGRLK